MNQTGFVLSLLLDLGRARPAVMLRLQVVAGRKRIVRKLSGVANIDAPSVQLEIPLPYSSIALIQVSSALTDCLCSYLAFSQPGKVRLTVQGLVVIPILSGTTRSVGTPFDRMPAIADRLYYCGCPCCFLVVFPCCFVGVLVVCQGFNNQ